MIAAAALNNIRRDTLLIRVAIRDGLRAGPGESVDALMRFQALGTAYVTVGLLLEALAIAAGQKRAPFVIRSDPA